MCASLGYQLDLYYVELMLQTMSTRRDLRFIIACNRSWARYIGKMHRKLIVTELVVEICRKKTRQPPCVIGYSVEAPYTTAFRRRLRLRISGSLLCDLLDG